MKKITGFFFLLMAACAHSEKSEIPPQSERPCYSFLEKEIQKSALEVGKKKPERSALIDITYPYNKKEYELLNKMGLMALAVFSHHPKELPFSEVYVQTSEMKVLLPQIFPLSPVLKTKDPKAKENLGANFQKAYFFIPLHLMRQKGELIVTLKDQKKKVLAAKFPAQIQLDFVTEDPNPQEDQGKAPDPDQVLLLLEKQYCLGKPSF